MNSEPHPPKKKHLTLLSLAAFSVGILALAFSLIGLWAQSINWYLSSYLAQGPHPRIGSIGTFLARAGLCGGFTGLLISIAAIVQGLLRKPRTMKILVGFLSFLVSFWAFLMFGLSHVLVSPAIPYAHDLHSIGRTLGKYAEAYNGQLPPADSWCGTLLRFGPGLTPYNFMTDRTHNDAEDISDFAMNAYVSNLNLSNLPEDIVLLFETPLAKNPAGGPELMSMNNHPAKGCFVLFADMHVEFVRAEDFNNLRWKP